MSSSSLLGKLHIAGELVLEQKLYYNGAVGRIVKIVYADKQGPNMENAPLPAYIVVDFPFMKIPEDEAWDKNNPT
jgi:hypothetical protein